MACTAPIMTVPTTTACSPSLTVHLRRRVRSTSLRPTSAESKPEVPDNGPPPWCHGPTIATLHSTYRESWRGKSFVRRPGRSGSGLQKILRSTDSEHHGLLSTSLSRSSLAPFTAKIRTIHGPEPAMSASKLAFALVRSMCTVYHQQTTSLLVHNIRIGHEGLPSQGTTVLASCQHPPIVRRPGTTPDRTNYQRPEETRSRPLEWCIDGHSVISSLRRCGEFGGQGGLVGL